MNFDPVVRVKADEAFSQARRRVFFQRVREFLTGQHGDDLLSFEEVRAKLKIHGQHYAGVQIVPLDKIAGSVGRYQEFNRAFLPTQEFIRERWKRVYEAAHSPGGFPAIAVYKIGDVYFVRDGHHRVSVLKELGATSVEATVIELETPIPLSADVDELELDIKEEYATFLQDTGLGALSLERPIEFTLPGQYRRLYEHVAVNRYYVGLKEDQEISAEEAAARWYCEVYCPVVDVIRDEAILDSFPERTEADLYLWIIEHRHYLTERGGQEVHLEEAAAQFSREFGSGQGKRHLKAEVKKIQELGRKKEAVRVKVAMFGSGSAPAGHPVLAEAEQLGGLLAEAGWTLVCGGYGGTMEAASRGARQAGGQVIGVTMDLFTPRLAPNPWLTKEQRVKDFFPRLKKLTSAHAFVVLQGGIGTLTEATLTWSLLQTGQISPRPFVFVGDQWRHILETFRAETLMTERDWGWITAVDSVEDAIAALKESLAPTP